MTFQTTNVFPQSAAFAPEVVESVIAALDNDQFFHHINAGLGGYSITRYSRETGLVVGWIAKE